MERKEKNSVEVLVILLPIFYFLTDRRCWTAVNLTRAHLSGYPRSVSRQFMDLGKFEKEIQL